MSSYVPPIKNSEYIFYIGVFSQADTKLLQANPTIASGDFKVSTDGGSFTNLDTIPAVTPASGTAIKVTLSTDEMNGDNVVVAGIDAAGAEWCDIIINIQTSAQSLDATDIVVDAIKVVVDAIGGDATAANQLLLIKILTRNWEIIGNQLIMYDDDGTTPLYTFDLTREGVPTSFNPEKRERV